MVAVGVGREQPLPRPPQIAVVTGSEGQVEMVGHQAITEQINRNCQDSGCRCNLTHTADLTHRLENSDGDGVRDVQAPRRRANRNPQRSLGATL
jgi:hypothetical protein